MFFVLSSSLLLLQTSNAFNMIGFFPDDDFGDDGGGDDVGGDGDGGGDVGGDGDVDDELFIQLSPSTISCFEWCARVGVCSSAVFLEPEVTR